MNNNSYIPGKLFPFIPGKLFPLTQFEYIQLKLSNTSDLLVDKKVFGNSNDKIKNSYNVKKNNHPIKEAKGAYSKLSDTKKSFNDKDLNINDNDVLSPKSRISFRDLGIYLNSLLSKGDINGIINIIRGCFNKPKEIINLDEGKDDIELFKCLRGEPVRTLLYFLEVIPELHENYVSAIKFYAEKILNTDYGYYNSMERISKRCDYRKTQYAEFGTVDIGCVLGQLKKLFVEEGNANKEITDLWKRLGIKFSDSNLKSMGFTDHFANRIRAIFVGKFIDRVLPCQEKIINLLQNENLTLDQEKTEETEIVSLLKQNIRADYEKDSYPAKTMEKVGFLPSDHKILPLKRVHGLDGERDGHQPKKIKKLGPLSKENIDEIWGGLVSL